MEAASASDSAKADLNNLQLTSEADSYPEHEIPPCLLLEPQFRPTYVASDILNEQLNQKLIPTEGSQSIFSGAPSFNRKEAISNNGTSGNDHAVLAHTATFSLKRWNSLPAKTKLNNVSISSAADVEMHNEQHTLDRQTIIKTVQRSLSMPTQNFVIVKDGPIPFQKMGTHDDSSDGNFVNVQIKNDDDDIHEGDAVCRICLAEFDGDGTCLKMECNCKGALRLTHEACAVKWFSLKGNRKCDVCCQEVFNLPVTLRRLLSSDPIPETQLVVNQILDNQQSSNQRVETQLSFNERFGNQPRLNRGSNSEMARPIHARHS